MVGHLDWNQYKWVLPQITKAKKKVQQTLKPGGGGAGSSNIGNAFPNFIKEQIILLPQIQSLSIPVQLKTT